MTDEAPERLGLTPPDRPEPAKDGDAVAAARDFAVEAARLMADLHCTDVVVFDVRGASQLTDYIVVASGTSDRQIKAVGSRVADLGAERGFDRYGTDRDEASTWLVLDFVEVMAHLFEPATRAHYDLEMMWGDCPTVPWRREADERGESDEAGDDEADEA